MQLPDISTWRRLSWETGFVILGQAAGLGGAIVGMRLLTGKVEPSIWGQVALLSTVVLLFGQVCFGPLSAWMQRNFVPFREKSELGRYFGILGWINRRCLALVLAGVLVLTALWFRQIVWALPAALVCGGAYLQGLNNQMTALQNSGRNRATAALHQAGATWLRPLAAYAVVVLAGATAASVLGGYLLGLTVVFASQLFFLRRLWPGAGVKFSGVKASRPSAEHIKSILWFGGPMAIWGLTGWLQLSADRWVVKYYLNESSVGILAVSVTLASIPIIAISGVISNLFYPIIVERAGDGSDANRMGRAMSVFKLELLAFGLVSSVWVCAAFLLRYWIVGLAVAREYQAASRYFPVLTVGWTLLGLVMQIHHAGQVFQATRRFLIPTVCCSLLALILTIIGTSRWGLIGTAGAFVLASALTALAAAGTAWSLIRSTMASLQSKQPYQSGPAEEPQAPLVKAYALNRTSGR